jgi:uncharacterized protein YndB with AHSA1/START domain
MQKQLILRDSIAIHASASRVWEILTSPGETKKYMFGCEARTDWKTDSPLLWNTFIDGKEVTLVKGNIIEIEHNRFLAYTMIDPRSGIEDIPDNYLTVSYELSVDNELTILTITQGDFSIIANGSETIQ